MFKAIRIVQYVWLVIALLSLGIAIYKAIAGDMDSAAYFGAITFVGAMMYYLNYRRYKKLTGQSKEKNG